MSTPVPAQRARSVVLIAVAAVAIACGENASPTTPLLAPATISAARGSAGHHRSPVIGRGESLTADETACRYINPARTTRDVTIALSRAGLRVTFPAGSVPTASNICLTAHAGALLTYDFQPHGLRFARPILVQQDLRRTRAYHDGSVAGTLVAGYLANGVAADVDALGNAQFAETFETSVVDDAGAPTTRSPSRISFQTIHFSGYALASGKADSTTKPSGR
jgi:hypothetical protein